MNSRVYWATREAEQLRHNIKEEKEYDKQIEKIYKNMLDSCQKEIDSFYGRYARREGITLAEAKKRVSELDIKAYERKAEKYVKDRVFSKEANEEMRLYNLTMKVNRLEMLKANIGLELISGHDELQKFMGDILQGRTERELKRQAGILGETVQNNAKKAHAIVNASFHNATYSERVWGNQTMLKSELSKLLQSGLIQGKNPRALAKELGKTFDTSKKNLERLMRTELARVQTEAQKQSFIKNGFEEYTFLSLSEGSGTCPICLGLNGKHFKVKYMMPGTNAPPMHPYCRCSTSAYEDSDEYEAWIDQLANGGEKARKNIEKFSKSDTIKSTTIAMAMAKKIPDAKTRSRIINEAINADLPVYAEDLRQAYKNVKPKDGYKDIVLHGAPHYTEYEKTYILDTETLYLIISGRRDWQGGNIRLLSCSTGKVDKYGNCVAQKLADLLGVEVYAPTGDLNMHLDGTLTVGRKRIAEDEGFKIFRPRSKK